MKEISEEKLKQNIEELTRKQSESGKPSSDEISVKDYEKFIQSLQDERSITGGSGVSAYYSAQSRSKGMDPRFKRRMVIVGLCILLSLMFITYIFALAFEQSGNFTVEVTDNPNNYKLTLSHTDNDGDEEEGQRLTSYPVENMRDNTFNYIIQNNKELIKQLQTKPTQVETDHYMLYTFQVKNDSLVAVGYKWTLEMTIDTGNLSSAIRVMIIKNAATATDESYYNVYAKAESDGSPALLFYDDNTGTEEIVSDGTLTIPFYDVENGIIATSGLLPMLSRGTTDTYTVVLWIEGTDPECIGTKDDPNSILGGEVALRMLFEVVSGD